MYEQYEHLQIERRGKILTVTLKGTTPMNPIISAMHGELSHVFHRIATDRETDVVVLTGAGDVFSAGGDIKSIVKNLDNHARWLETMREARLIVEGLTALDQPIIARVNGHAVGLGATIALYCDLIVAVDTAMIGDPHVKIGLVAGDGGAVIWPHHIGMARAKESLLLGDSMTAARAAEIGLINYAVPAAELDRKVDELADRLAAGAGVAIRGTKRAMNAVLRKQIADHMDGNLGLETLSHYSEDHRGAVHAFAEKRKYQFTGR